MLVNFSYLCQSSPNVLLLHSVKCLIVIQDHFNFNPCNRAIELNQCMTHVTRCPFFTFAFCPCAYMFTLFLVSFKSLQCIRRTEGLRKTDCMYGCSSHMIEWVWSLVISVGLEGHQRSYGVGLWPHQLYASSVGAFLPVPISQLRLITTCTHQSRTFQVVQLRPEIFWDIHFCHRVSKLDIGGMIIQIGKILLHRGKTRELWDH